MPGRFEGMSDAEWELVEDIFPAKAKKKPWNACGASAQGFEFAAVHFEDWLPLVRSSAKRAMGIQECKPSLAENLAFRRKAQGIASAVDGSFSMRKRRMCRCCIDIKGKAF